MLVGFAWVHRISSIREDPDRSFSRLSGQRGGGSRLPDAPDIPTRGWLLTRGAILIGVGAVAFAFFGPQVMRRWDPAFEAGGIAVAMWIVAVLAAAVGTAWMIRIAVRAPGRRRAGLAIPPLAPQRFVRALFQLSRWRLPHSGSPAVCS